MGMFYFMDAIFPIFFMLVFGMIIFTFFKGIKEWNHNNQQPVLSVAAKIISKRKHTSTNVHHHNEHHHHHTSTTYYITFEVESGDRMEFVVSSKEYGYMAEGDVGKLTFQGSRFHDFDRRMNE